MGDLVTTKPHDPQANIEAGKIEKREKMVGLATDTRLANVRKEVTKVDRGRVRVRSGARHIDTFGARLAVLGLTHIHERFIPLLALSTHPPLHQSQGLT